MIEALISSKTRIKLLLKFFLNSNNTAYLRNLEEEFQESTNSIRIELNRFEEAGLLIASISGNKKIFKVNTSNSFFKDLHSLVKKYFGIDRIIEDIILKLGDLQAAYLAGNLAKGLNDEVVELVLIGSLNEEYLKKLVKKVEKEVKRSIVIREYASKAEAIDKEIKFDTYLLLWSKEIDLRY
jgi:hypothetical protein